LTFAFHADSITKVKTLDHKASRAIHKLRFGRLDYGIAVPGMLFGTYFMPAVIVLAGIGVNWRLAALMAMGALSTLAVTAPLKHIVNRPRPNPPEPRVLRLRNLVNSPAFPSGDSAQAAMVVVLLIVLAPPGGAAGLVWLPLLPLCMFSRVYFGAHWWGDTVAGAAIGVAVALLYVSLFGGWVAAA
jgi:membrane-associated phospholipid phosphatase